MSQQKDLAIHLNDGKVLHVDRRLIQRIVFPGVVINNAYTRFVLDLSSVANMEKQIEELRRKLGR